METELELTNEHVKIISKYHPYLIECPCGFRYGSGSRHLNLKCNNIKCGRTLDVLIHSTDEKGFNKVFKNVSETIEKEKEND